MFFKRIIKPKGSSGNAATTYFGKGEEHMIDKYDWTDYAEPSEVDELFKEFQEKCMDILCNNVKSEVDAIITRNAQLTEENEELKKKSKSFENIAIERTKSLNDSGTVLKMLKYLKNSLDYEKVYSLFELMFEKDFEENLYEVPLWLGILTQYYSHKDEAIEFLRLLDVELPDKIENFRLPIDWTEQELDIFFDTMHNHVNCNCCVYASNLKFWGKYSLMSVEDQCKKTFYDEIPWQYVLRNPLLKKEKYLKQIGKHMISIPSSNWSKFSNIDEYLELEPKELKVIFDNIDYQLWANKDKDITNFILRHIDLIDNKNFLNKVYDFCHNSYDFTCKYKILDMPFTYVKKWCSEHTNNAMNLLRDKKTEFTDEQRNELLAAILG